MAAEPGTLLDDCVPGVKEQEELSWVSRLEMRWLKALWIERRSCVMVVKGAEVPLQASTCWIVKETWGYTQEGAPGGGAQDSVPLVSRVTSGMKRKRPS